MPHLLRVLLQVILTLAMLSAVVGAEGDSQPGMGETVGIANEHIRIVVNAETENTGRFALETTGGDPDRFSDDGEPLIYGRPKPWTSYTTIRVGSEDYVFGGSTTKRAGLQAKYGSVVAGPIIQGDGVDTIAQIGPLEVLQRLEFAISSTTGYRDSARIIYRVTNLSDLPQQVGIRIMLDTLLGTNDGAPFRFHEEAVLGDSEYRYEALPEFWQAFDSLSDPRVIAQGTLVGPDVTRPDRIIFSNWGSFADGLWEVDFQPDREFLRLGEFELDSAVGLFWEPSLLQPGESRTFVTGYGMGGLSISPGELSLGMTSPATVSLGSDGKARIPVIAYLENTGAGIGRELSLTLKTPTGMEFIAGTPGTKKVGYLRPGRGTQASWELEASPALAGKVVSLRVEVTGPDIQPVAVERRLRIMGPPDLGLVLQNRLREDDTGYYIIEATLSNKGQSSAYNVEATLDVPDGWKAAPHEQLTRFLGEIAPRAKEISWQWQVKPEDMSSISALDVKLTSTNAARKNISTGELLVRGSRPQVILQPASPSVAANSLAIVTIKAQDIQGFSGIKTTLQYDPSRLVFLGYSRGQLWVDAKGQTLEFVVDSNPREGQISIEGKLPSKDGIFTGDGEVIQVKFLPLTAGQYRVEFAEAPLVYTSVPGQEVKLEVAPLIVTE